MKNKKRKIKTKNSVTRSYGSRSREPNLRGRNRTVTVTLSFALLTSDGGVLEEHDDDGVVGLPPDFDAGDDAAAAAAGDFRDRSGDTVEEALWEERVQPAAKDMYIRTTTTRRRRGGGELFKKTKFQREKQGFRERERERRMKQKSRAGHGKWQRLWSLECASCHLALRLPPKSGQFTLLCCVLFFYLYFLIWKLNNKRMVKKLIYWSEMGRVVWCVWCWQCCSAGNVCFCLLTDCHCCCLVGL